MQEEIYNIIGKPGSVVSLCVKGLPNPLSENYVFEFFFYVITGG